MAPRNVPPVEERDPYDDYNDRIAAEQNGADVGYYNAPTQRFAAPSTSARRYTVDRPATNPTTTLRKASQGATPTRSRKTVDYQVEEMGDDEVLYGSKNAHRRTTGSRPSRTDEDKQITTRIRRVDTVAPAPYSVSRRKLIAALVGSLAIGVVGGTAALSAIHDTQLVMAQGPYPERNISLVCGHGDSVSNPTLLHVYIWNYALVSIEAPGGQYGKDHQVVGTGLPTTGDVSKWELQVVPVKVGSKQFQIEIDVIGVDGAGQRFTYRWLLVDGGQGYFVGVK